MILFSTESFDYKFPGIRINWKWDFYLDFKNSVQIILCRNYVIKLYFRVISKNRVKVHFLNRISQLNMAGERKKLLLKASQLNFTQIQTCYFLTCSYIRFSFLLRNISNWQVLLLINAVNELYLTFSSKSRVQDRVFNEFPDSTGQETQKLTS